MLLETGRHQRAAAATLPSTEGHDRHDACQRTDCPQKYRLQSPPPGEPLLPGVRAGGFCALVVILQGTFSAHTGNVQGILWKHSGNIQETFLCAGGLRSGCVQPKCVAFPEVFALWLYMFVLRLLMYELWLYSV